MHRLRIIIRCSLLALLSVGVFAQPLQAWSRLACVPGAACAISGEPGPKCRTCCHSHQPAAVVRTNCCILNKGVPTEVRSDRPVVIVAIVHAPLTAVLTIPSDPRPERRLREDEACWLPPWAVSPEQGRAARPPPVV